MAKITKKERQIQKALGTLMKYKIYVVEEPKDGSRKMVEGFPYIIEACDAEDK